MEAITYTISDGNGGSVQGTVTVEVEDRTDVIQYRIEGVTARDEW